MYIISHSCRRSSTAASSSSQEVSTSSMYRLPSTAYLFENHLRRPSPSLSQMFYTCVNSSTIHQATNRIFPIFQRIHYNTLCHTNKIRATRSKYVCVKTYIYVYKKKEEKTQNLKKQTKIEELTSQNQLNHSQYPSKRNVLNLLNKVKGK